MAENLLELFILFGIMDSKKLRQFPDHIRITHRPYELLRIGYRSVYLC